MTCIAWDGKTLAADKQSTSGGFGSIITKIHRVPDGIVGLTGNQGHAMALLAWFKDGRNPEKWPKKAGDESAGAIFITKNGVYSYSGDDGPSAAKLENKFDAWGCGYAYALAAMHLGSDARTAVEVACALDVNCGKGIDTLDLETPHESRT